MEKYSEHHDKHWNSGDWGAKLFCCRLRKMRPQNAYYKHIPVELQELFNECGPARTNEECG